MAHHGREAVTVTMAIAMTVAVTSYCEDMKLARCWWHMVTLAVAITVTMTVAGRGCREDVKIASCWWCTVPVRLSVTMAMSITIAVAKNWLLEHCGHEEYFGDSIRDNFIGDTLGVNFRPFSMVKFLVAGPGSLLSESTAVYQCEGVDERVWLTVAIGRRF